MVLLDAFLPDYDVRELHSLAIDAPPEAVRDAAMALTLRDVPLARVLMAMRGLRSPDPDRPLLDRFQRGGFTLLGERADEVVLGVVGRFWRPRGDVRRTTPAEFAAFAEPGFAKGAINFRVTEHGDRTVLSTETRVLATDDGARRRFRLYWLLVRPGSGAIRLSMLRAIRKAASRG